MPSLVQKKFYGSVTVFWLDREEALRRLKERAQALLQQAPEVRKVVLFGSLARGRAIPGSDADILLLVSGEPGPFLERTQRYHPFFEGVGLPVDLFCYTGEEAQRIPLACTALKEGITLAERPAGP